MPYVGEIVHYVSHGTPGGEYQSECRAAIITEIIAIECVSLAVLNPEGMYFSTAVPYDAECAGGTWHSGLVGPATLSTPCPDGGLL